MIYKFAANGGLMRFPAPGPPIRGLAARRQPFLHLYGLSMFKDGGGEIENGCVSLGQRRAIPAPLQLR
jgi:hypothetical protein